MPRGWDKVLEGYVIETMPAVEHPAAVPLSLQTTEPDILLVDGDFPNLDLITLVKEAHKVRPEVAVIVLATDHTQRLLHQAMLAGVEEFLQKPVLASRLQETLIAVASHRTLRIESASTIESDDTPSTQGRVVGVISGKGGLGKTTIATNLATLMAKSKQSTALVGFESGDGAVLLDVQPRLGLYDMITALANREQAEDEKTYSAEWMKQYAAAYGNGLQYWTWRGASPQTSSQIPPQFINTFMESCRAAFNYTFIDFPSLADGEFSALLPLLDVVLVVSSTCDLLALRSTKNLLDQVTPEYRRRIRLIINRADPQDMIGKSDFEEALQFKAAATLPNQPHVAAAAINMGAPLVTTHQPSELSESLKNLAVQLFKLPKSKAEQKPVKRFGLF
ncbi:MAG: response regulator [Abditibacteriaceae bacterium]